MARLSAKLRSMTNGIMYWCPGCDSPHGINTQGGPPVWQWDGNAESPTCSPSVRCFMIDPETNEQTTLCHHFIKAGKIEFLSDSPHALAGQTVDLPDWPYAEGEYGGV